MSAPGLTALRRSARDCRRCEPYEDATRSLFGPKVKVTRMVEDLELVLSGLREAAVAS